MEVLSLSIKWELIPPIFVPKTNLDLSIFVVVDQESLKLLKTCLELNENFLNGEDILIIGCKMGTVNTNLDPFQALLNERRESILEGSAWRF